MNNLLPLFHYAHDQVVCRYAGRAIDGACFLSHVRHLAKQLPSCRYIINLCNDRYHFMIGFAAALLEKKISLFPPNQTSGSIDQLAEEYSESFCLTDDLIREMKSEQGESSFYNDTSLSEDYSIPMIESDRLAAIIYTSGSTGTPKANLKYWGDLQKGIGMAVARFAIRERGIRSLIGTVPQQHMFGFETTILIPWYCGITVHTGCPLFPADVRDALFHTQTPRLLITTPIHLRACQAAELEWPEIELVISSTAPLSGGLAASAETALSTLVMEIYGSTETGSVASRRTKEGDWWQLYDQMLLLQEGNRFSIQGPQLPEKIVLNDYLELQNHGRFRLVGRQEDLIKIAGKRASLGDLNHKLNAIAGVEDGAFLLPEKGDREITRLVAIVVAPGLSRDAILASLGKSLDPAFLPRRIYQVEALPRNSTGKLPRQSLVEMLEHL
ncbi:MAG: AMP-binding protein [Candidatus Thiodiazotropha sp. (ex Cardiolucina cf. quadrata)]|nr:AMP-binding protein [Candidatus Thiodiazotropha sp. (ex Cardiolucina cf. quadrata)]